MPVLTDNNDLEEILDGFMQFVEKEILPLELEEEELFTDPRLLFDETGRYSARALKLHKEARCRSSKAGYFGMCIPADLGGGGQGALLHFLAWERLFATFGPHRQLPLQCLAHWARGPSHIFAEASERVKEGVFQTLLSGEKTMCFALSEPDAGSDAWNLRTIAERKNDAWYISGTKQWSTNGPTADFALVFAVTDRDAARARKGGITAFVIPTCAPGFRVDSVVKLFGSSGGEEAIFSLDNVKATSEDVIGEVDSGFDLALSGISMGRMFNAGRAVGTARWALELATRYASDRWTFGNPISEYQGIQFALADCAQLIYAMKTMTVDCARRIEMGHPIRKELAIVKVFTAESSYTVLDSCMQVLGGMGLTNEIGLYEGWHQARISRIADGSSEIMRRTIARRLLAGDVSF